LYLIHFQEEIKEYVESVCNILPRTVASPCRRFIEQYGDLVIALLAQSLDPKTICSEIKACSGSKLKHSVLIGKYFVEDEDSLYSY
jgi:saposin